MLEPNQASAPAEKPAPLAEPQVPPPFVAPKPPVFTPPESELQTSEPAAPAEPAKPDAIFDGEFEPLELLEEEMAKLLGRPLKK